MLYYHKNRMKKSNNRIIDVIESASTVSYRKNRNKSERIKEEDKYTNRGVNFF